MAASVVVDLAVNSNVDLAKLGENGNSSSQTSLNMLLSGSLSDGAPLR